jgi:hypothetical protein
MRKIMKIKIITLLLIGITSMAYADGIELNKPIFPKDKKGVVKKEITVDKIPVTIVTQQNPFCTFEYNVLCVFTINGEEVRKEVHFNKSRQELTDKEILDKIQEVYDRSLYEQSDEAKIKRIDERLEEIKTIEAEKQELLNEKTNLIK